MKKPYVKPQLFYEDFELSQHIAACGWDMSNTKKKEDCEALGDVTEGNMALLLFLDTPRCEIVPADIENYCYEVGTGPNGVFNS